MKTLLKWLKQHVQKKNKTVIFGFNELKKFILKLLYRDKKRNIVNWF
jgi:hypothetical protein